MKAVKILALVILVLTCRFCSARADSELPPYHSYADFLLSSPGSMGCGLYGYMNPAILSYVHQSDLMFVWSDKAGEWNDSDRWGIFTAAPNVGFGVIHEKSEFGTVTDYRFSLAVGDKTGSFGIGYGWSGGERGLFNRGSIVTLGSLVRPAPQLSLGLSGAIATCGSAKEGVADLAVRPFGNELLTVFGDYAMQHDETLEDGHWSTGAVVEPLPGIRLTGRYFDSEAFSIGLSFSLGHLGVSSQSHYDENQEHSYNTYGVRVGSYDRNIFKTQLMRRKDYLELDLFGQVKYQRYVLFDKSNTLMDLISTIERVKQDESVGGIAINTSGIQINREVSWELREKLRDFKSTGKHIVIFIDGAGIDQYHFVSIADKIVLDPTGLITLEGFLLGRNYLKGTLEKLGLGFDEWRFFKYKSAAETLSRDRMSEADREQRQRLVDEYYRLAKTEICEARKMDPDEFDRLVNEEMIFMPRDAVEKGLVDTLGRWETVKEIVNKLEGGKRRLVSPAKMAKCELPSDSHWGERPRIAVVYALGVCAMDEGITARKLVKDVERVTKDARIKAVVLRVDSPGGDAMASDIVAEAIEKCAEKKPVIVSQGFVAASGGYWLSMYGDTIVAAPHTITGSIGVIGGWLYNKGFKDKLGMSTDFVKAGDHADLGFGIRLPLVNVRIPDRNLDDEERSKAEHLIKTFYKEFLEKVASGRNMEYDEIESIAQGRVWSGYDGKENGLVDVLGGLQTAINIAKVKAGIPEGEDVAIVELPKPGLFDLSGLIPRLFGVEYTDDEFLSLLKFRLKHNGEPLPMLPLEDMEMVIGHSQWSH